MTVGDKRIFKVLLIEDDPMVQEVNRMFIEQIPGFEVVGAAGNGSEGLRLIRELMPDLVILDVFMPSLGGVETLRQLRTAALPVDVIVVTAAKDAETIRTMLRGGAFDYIIKPFKLERIKKTLERYRKHQEAWKDDPAINQDELDRLLHTPASVLMSSEPPQDMTAGFTFEQDDLPKGLNAVTLKQVLQVMERSEDGLSAEDTADRVGIARVTARRYLDFLEKSGRVKLEINYGGIGRPVNRYILLRDS
ncbi:response regulator [Paenibacillus tarimensis]